MQVSILRFQLHAHISVERHKKVQLFAGFTDAPIKASTKETTTPRQKSNARFTVQNPLGNVAILDCTPFVIFLVDSARQAHTECGIVGGCLIVMP